MNTCELVEKKARCIRPESYHNLLRTLNRGHTNSTYVKKARVTCPCGKAMFQSQYENHINTKTHEKLMKYKIRTSSAVAT